MVNIFNFKYDKTNKLLISSVIKIAGPDKDYSDFDYKINSTYYVDVHNHITGKVFSFYYTLTDGYEQIGNSNIRYTYWRNDYLNIRLKIYDVYN